MPQATTAASQYKSFSISGLLPFRFSSNQGRHIYHYFHSSSSCPAWLANPSLTEYILRTFSGAAADKARFYTIRPDESTARRRCRLYSLLSMKDIKDDDGDAARLSISTRISATSQSPTISLRNLQVQGLAFRVDQWTSLRGPSKDSSM